jgi:hypothetical protein
MASFAEHEREMSSKGTKAPGVKLGLNDAHIAARHQP